jgi:biotin synthase-like enzyme
MTQLRAIFGMGESDEDIVDLAFDLRRLDPDSVPVNFLIPFEGTPLEGKRELTPERCPRILALFRFCFPDVEVRMAGGRICADCRSWRCISSIRSSWVATSRVKGSPARTICT